MRRSTKTSSQAEILEQIEPDLGSILVLRSAHASMGGICRVDDIPLPCIPDYVKKSKKQPRHSALARSVGRALRLAAIEARRVAKLHGTLIYISKDGKVVAIDP